MITYESFKRFVQAIQQYINSTDQSTHHQLSWVRENVADALHLPKLEHQRRTALEQYPIPFNGEVCEQIGSHFGTIGIELPARAWEWPLHEKMALSASERKDIWREACDFFAQQKGAFHGAPLDQYATVEPYIRPAGSGSWYFCNRSPVPFKLCSTILGPHRVERRDKDNTIADDKCTRNAEDILFHGALIAFRNGDSQATFRLLKKSADCGHGQAAFNAALLLEEGQGVEQNLELALQYYQIAAARGVAMADHNLGGIFLHGNARLPKNIQQAIAHFERAAKSGIAASWGCLGSIYLHGNGVPPDREKAVDLLLQGEAMGDDHSANVLACIADEENGGVSDRTSFERYREAARHAKLWNHALPFFNLGLCYLNGNGVKPNLRTARRLFLIAAKAGDTDAAHHLGRMYLYGHGTPANYNKAIAMIEWAASHDNPNALNMLGSIHLTGTWMPPDYPRAIELFEQAIVLGSTDAIVNLGQCFAHGCGVDADLERAQQLFELAEERGNTSGADLRAQWFGSSEDGETPVMSGSDLH